MFDAKSLFDMIAKAGQPQSSSGPGVPGGSGSGGGMADLGDLLRQFTQQQGGSAPAGQPSGGQMADHANSPTGAPSGSALDDLLRQFAPGSNQSGGTRPADDGSGSGAGAGSALEDLLRQFTQNRGDDQSSQGGGMRELPDAGASSSGQGSGGGLGDIFGDILGQSGGQGGGRTDSQSRDGGPAPGIRDLLEKIGGSGATSGDLVRQLTDFIGNNKVGAGAALGGLGALIFGTQTGRSIAMSAAKVGALAVVGGLAYKAYQNYTQGRPVVSGRIAPEPAPAGTGFEAEEVSNDAAVTYIRGMIAAAAADGRIDATEQQQIIGALSQQGIDAQAEEFLANELNNPASIAELVNGVANQTESLQLYSAARLAIEPDSASEQHFLAELADQLGITPDLRAHVDAAARGLA